MEDGRLTRELSPLKRKGAAKSVAYACMVEIGVCTSKGVLSRETWLVWSWCTSDAYARREALGKDEEEESFGYLGLSYVAAAKRNSLVYAA